MDKIICIGKNYSEHVKEMALLLGDAVPEKPVLFLKPPSVLKVAARNGETLSLHLPPDAGVIHHECEIVLRLSSGGYCLSLEEAERAIESVTLGLDMTRRETQAILKKQGHPWTISKVFLDSAVVGPWKKVAEFPDFLDVPFRFSLDGKLRQEGHGRDMVTNPAAALAYISECFPLCPGDLVFTGCPAGVGPVTPGQTGTLQWGDIEYRVTWS